MTTQPRPVYVIGAGPGGLAVAAALRARGVRAVVVEKSDAVGTSWRGHYDRLHLHTTRRLSALPGLAIPRRFGRWVSRDDVVRYLEKYAEFHELEIVTGVEVTRIERAPQEGDARHEGDAPREGDTPRGDGATQAGRAPQSGAAPGWTLHASGGRVLAARAVVVATGFNHTPRLPDWPGRDTYTGTLTHAAGYRDPKPYEGRDVLVVGVGNTGAEIAVDLAGGGAARVRLAVRTAPHIVRRSTAGWPAQRTGILVRRLPVRLVDRLGALVAKASVPDLAAYGLPRPETGLYSRVEEGAIPVQDVGLIDAVRTGGVEPVAAVVSFDGDEVVLADGSRITPDAVIAATGYRRALEGLVGHLDVLDGRGRPLVHGARTPAQAPGLYFTGFTNPISGMFREMALDAEKISSALARHLAGGGRARRRRTPRSGTGLPPVAPLA
ncbi:NAD(P)-binding domain-containing protein [Streptomyces sp. APSN-46.1]|uniref:flavin-containing monooxygenase n=1 Tax=Streptomyces sp. APSN-46.1 TaxID=2929049 RepID=UPI001FB205F9|nr:NAD(P)-binding domain-containing protein [Streptomyces sp. APSN-46.1]MCJ1679189.1 NAD(P)-binding domain-containing protein [Streptomyces sp. APSN-46.1]